MTNQSSRGMTKALTTRLSVARPPNIAIYLERPLLIGDKRRLLTLDRFTGDIRAWDALTGELLLTIERRADDWALPPDGSRLAILDREGFLRILKID